RKALAALGVPIFVAGQELQVEVSIGISICPRDARDAQTLVKFADTALYLAKDEGRNTFRFFSPELDARVRARLLLENDLRKAIPREQLVLYSQPQVDWMGAEITGVEALVRWDPRERGLVMPADFIPIAEETGLIVPLGEWVLRTACEQARAWREAGRSVR